MWSAPAVNCYPVNVGTSNKHSAGEVQRFGDPLSPSGAIYCFSDVEAFFVARKEIARADILAAGGQLTPELELALERHPIEEQARYVAEVEARGIPDRIRQVLRLGRGGASPNRRKPAKCSPEE